MERNQIAKWLFVYFFLVTIFLAFFLILFGKSLLHIDDVNGIVAILLPTFLGQLTLIVKWLVDESLRINNEKIVFNISPFLIKAPPLTMLALIIITFLTRIIGYNMDASWTPDDNQIKVLFTFIMSVFNATTIYLISIYFSKKNN